jgi:hypothetical protein
LFDILVLQTAWGGEFGDYIAGYKKPAQGKGYRIVHRKTKGFMGYSAL